jgi:hypothetical protein
MSPAIHQCSLSKVLSNKILQDKHKSIFFVKKKLMKGYVLFQNISRTAAPFSDILKHTQTYSCAKFPCPESAHATSKM